MWGFLFVMHGGQKPIKITDRATGGDRIDHHLANEGEFQ